MRVTLPAALFASLSLLVSCEEDGPLPVLTTFEVEQITATSAVTGGLITSDGGQSVIARGVCWGTSPSPTINDNKTQDGPGGGSFVSLLTGLTPSTTYFVRAYATNGNGTSYGLSFAFQTQNGQINVTTNPVIEVGCLTAVLGGHVADVGLPLTAKGLCWSTSPTPTLADEFSDEGVTPGEFSSTLHGLGCGTKYYVRAYATNSAGTFYGNETSFTTVAGSTLLATSIEFIGLNTATANGNLNAISYPVTSRGFCWGADHDPTLAGPNTASGSGVGNFTGYVTGLSSNAIYYVRAYASTTEGVIYGNEATLVTLEPMFSDAGTVSDVDGNSYRAIEIGTQTWIAENLRVSTYKDGVPIPLVPGIVDWGAATGGAYCWYENDQEYEDPYGKLYNVFAVNSGKLCPAGWHAPTSAEFDLLISNLGGTAEAGTKMKEDGIGHWKSPGGSNISGFTGLPGSGRASNGEFHTDVIGYYGHWWASGGAAFEYILDANSGSIDKVANPGDESGFSVRCVKD